jgi:anti-sigma28 factor (negative regulator of flagellin synthesis)
MMSLGRAEKVQHIKVAIAQGTYYVEAQTVARAMLRRGGW